MKIIKRRLYELNIIRNDINEYIINKKDRHDVREFINYLNTLDYDISKEEFEKLINDSLNGDMKSKSKLLTLSLPYITLIIIRNFGNKNVSVIDLIQNFSYKFMRGFLTEKINVNNFYRNMYIRCYRFSNEYISENDLEDKDIIVDSFYTIENDIVDKIELDSVFKSLSSNRLKVLYLYYVLGYTEDEIGKILNVKYQTVSNALEKTHIFINNKLLQSEIYNYIDNLLELNDIEKLIFSSLLNGKSINMISTELFLTKIFILKVIDNIKLKINNNRDVINIELFNELPIGIEKDAYKSLRKIFI